MDSPPRQSPSRRGLHGVPPVRTNSFMARKGDLAVGVQPKAAQSRRPYRATAAGGVTPVHVVADSDSEAEDVVRNRLLELTFADRPPKLDPHQFDAVNLNTEYNNVSVEDIERRLKDSFVFDAEERRCTEMRLTIDPRGPFMKHWDVLMMVLILYVALITPFEIGFLEDAGGALVFINRLVDALFFIDMFVNFFLGYFDEHGQWEFDNKKIAFHYLKGWFIVDFLSVIPFDFIADTSGSDTVENLKILRLVRLLRLIKLARVIRASRLVKRWEMGTDVSYSTIGMTKHLVVTTVSTHWVTCLLHLVTSLEGVEENWVTVDMEIGTLRDEPVFGLYTAAFYSAVQALPMGVPNSVVPVTTWERISSIFAMLFLGSIYAYVIGSICDVVANLDPATNEFQNNMDTLNAFMEEKQLPREKRREIREYFHHCKALFRQKFYHELLEQMSPKMRGDTAFHMHGYVVCTCVWSALHRAAGVAQQHVSHGCRWIGNVAPTGSGFKRFRSSKPQTWKNDGSLSRPSHWRWSPWRLPRRSCSSESASSQSRCTSFNEAWWRAWAESLVPAVLLARWVCVRSGCRTCVVMQQSRRVHAHFVLLCPCGVGVECGCVGLTVVVCAERRT